MSARERLISAIRPLGALGVIALVLLAGAGWFYGAVVKPLEARNLELGEQLERRGRGTAPDSRLLRISTPGAKLAAFYDFFDREETLTDWLAKLYAIGGGIGIDLRSADYRLSAQAGRLDRYQITLPVKGTSAQIRAFAASALDAIPVASLDQVVFRRKRTSDAMVEAEVALSLYLLRK